MSLTNTGLSGLNFLIVVKMSGRCVSRCVERESYLQFSMTEMQCYSGPMLREGLLYWQFCMERVDRSTLNISGN